MTDFDRLESEQHQDTVQLTRYLPDGSPDHANSRVFHGAVMLANGGRLLYAHPSVQIELEIDCGHDDIAQATRDNLKKVSVTMAYCNLDAFNLLYGDLPDEGTG